MGRRPKSLSDSVETEILADNTAGASAPAALGDGSLAERSLQERVEKTRVRQKSYVMDLRIHSPASLGYLGIEGLDTAPALVRLARVKGLDVIAVTDFYSGQFIDRVINAAKAYNSPLTVIPGVVIRCAIQKCEDVLLLCLFPESCTSQDIERFLTALEVPSSAFGSRSFVIHKPMPDILRVVEQFQGLAVPSRMDKTPSRLSVVPMLIEQYGFRAFDLAYADSVKYFKTRWPRLKFHLFSFSNANTLAQVGSRMSRVKMALPGFAGLKQLVTRGCIAAQ